MNDSQRDAFAAAFRQLSPAEAYACIEQPSVTDRFKRAARFGDAAEVATDVQDATSQAVPLSEVDLLGTTSCSSSCSSSSASSPSSAPRPILPVLSLAELEAQITELAGHLNAATHRWLTLIAQFDRRDGWGDGSSQSCAHWLSWKCGLNLGSARERVRVAHALETLPLISAAMARGALSYSKVRAMTRVATAATEDELLMIALHGTAHHIETLVRHYRRAQDAAELSREAQQFAHRQVSYFFDDDGSLVLSARLPAETGAVLVKALEVATQDSYRKNIPAGTSTIADARDSIDPCDSVAGSDDNRSDELCSDGLRSDERHSEDHHSDERRPDNSKYTLSHRRADALGLFAETFLKHGYQALSGGERQQIVIHVDAQTLIDGSAGRCELESGPALAAQTARRLSCDASLVTITEDEAGQPLDVGRKTRSIPPAIRRALRSRDPTCRFPGCSQSQFLDGHHIEHWADGGATKLSNLVMLCRFHHRELHEGRVNVQVLNDGAFHFTGARGKLFELAVAARGDTDTLRSQHHDCGIKIDAATAVTHWLGETMDYGIAIDAMLQGEQRYQQNQ